MLMLIDLGYCSWYWCYQYTCITTTPVSRLHLYHDYTCITTTHVSRLHLYHEHLHMQYSRNIWIEISTQQSVECTSKNKQSQVFHSSGNELNSRVVEGYVRVYGYFTTHYNLHAIKDTFWLTSDDYLLYVKKCYKVFNWINDVQNTKQTSTCVSEETIDIFMSSFCLNLPYMYLYKLCRPLSTNLEITRSTLI